MNRTITELKLPDSGATVNLYESLTYGDFRKIQKKLLESVKIDVNEAKKGTIPEIPGTAAIDNQDMTMDLLVKGIKDSEGNIVNNIKEFIDNLSMKDGQTIENKVTEINNNSSLTTSRKKK